MTYSYDKPARGSGARSVKWNAIALVGRQLLIIIFSIVLARLLGPESYGIVAQATVYTTFTTLLLDQGVSASLLSRRTIDRELLGVATTVNVGFAALLAVLTVPLSPVIAEFMNTTELVLVLPVLGVGLVLKGAQVVPRMLLMREFRFQALAAVEIISALIGGVGGVVAAFLGFSYWALVIQLILSDLILAGGLYAAARPPLPNLKFRRFAEILGFSIKVFVSNIFGFAARNADTVLVGKFLGQSQVGLYSLAYRVLLLPIQMVGQTVTRVVFPVIARDREDPGRVSATLLRSSRSIAFITFPAMAFVAVASYDAVDVVLGEAWLPAVPVMAILAITGARQSVTALNTPTMLGFARADMQLWFTIVSTIVQIGGIIAGLPFGIVGVAAGYTIAGLILTPWILWIQRDLAGTPILRQLAVMAAPAHASLWAAAVYALAYLIAVPSVVRLIGGGVCGLLIFFGVMWLFHRRSLRESIEDAVGIVRSRPPVAVVGA